MTKSNPIPTERATHKLQNDSTKEAPPWSEGSEPPRQAFQPGELANGLGIPRASDFEGQQDLTVGFP